MHRVIGAFLGSFLGCVGFAARSIIRAAEERNGFIDHLDATPRRNESPVLMPHHQRYLFVCTNRRPDGHPKGSCAAVGSEALVPALKAAVAEAGGKGIVRACASGCLDLCEIGASIVQEPDHIAYGNVTAADLPEIAAAAVRGEVVTRLVVYPPRATEG